MLSKVELLQFCFNEVMLDFLSFLIRRYAVDYSSMLLIVVVSLVML
jgi:hypothetical protein